MEHIDLYKESCASFRHYSHAALNIRITVVAQGIVLLSASGYLFKESMAHYSIATAFFGIVFTTALMVLHENYQRKCCILINASSMLEKKMNNVEILPMVMLEDDHAKFLMQLGGELKVIQSLFYLMISSFSLIIIAVFATMPCPFLWN